MVEQVLVRAGFVRRTTDGGTTWTAAGTFAADVYTITAINANVAIAANWTSTYTRLVKTTDGGATWRTVDSVALAASMTTSGCSTQTTVLPRAIPSAATG